MDYSTDFICTYLHLDDFQEQEDLYRIQFLQAFMIEQWDDNIISEKTTNLFKLVKNNKQFKIIFDKARKSDNLQLLIFLAGTQDFDIFKLLFKFELFTYTHKCICDFINENYISDLSFNNLLNNL
tara:strand:+ start:2467 stop:2841 length:375 start_codon:yes stop_codon:yes gene_type:complete